MKKSLVLIGILFTLMSSYAKLANAQSKMNTAIFIGPVHLGIAQQFDFNKQHNFNISLGLGLHMWDFGEMKYADMYTYRQSQSQVGAVGMMGDLRAWAVGFTSLQYRYFFVKSKRDNSQLANGLNLGLKAKFNTGAIISEKEKLDQITSTSMLIPCVGFKKYFNEDKSFFDVNAGIGIITNSHFATLDYFPSVNINFGFIIIK